MKRIPLYASVTLVLAACSMAPNYERPDMPVNSVFPVTEKISSEASVKAYQIGWKQYFKDSRLKEYISTALENNRDLRIALLNVEQARVAYNISISDRLPGINGGGGYSRSRSGINPSTGRSNISEGYNVSAGISQFELDFFGKMKSMSDQALNKYLATAEGQKAAQIALVAQVARTYVQLRTAEEQLALAKITARTYNDSYQLIKQQVAAGIANDLNLAQAKAQVYSSQVAVASAERAINVAKTGLDQIVGKSIQPVNKGLSVKNSAFLAKVPVGLPSEVLLLHPDVMSAEYLLKADNANIGAARAAFFPSISLTTNAGSISPQFSNLFENATATWAFSPTISIPIFNWGKIKSNYDLAKLQKEVSIATYEKAIQSAFANVSTALVSEQPLKKQLQAQRGLVASTQESLRLANLLYENGISSYLDVLDAQRTSFSAQVNLLSAYQENILNGINLYVALGGGILENTELNYQPK